MNAKRRFGLHFLLCLAATTGVAVAALLWFGFTPMTAVFAALALGCPVAAFYAWRLSRRVQRSIDANAAHRAGARRLR